MIKNSGLLVEEDLPSEIRKQGLNLKLEKIIGSGAFGTVAKYKAKSGNYAIKFESN